MTQSIRLDGRVAIVTGGGRGLGRAYCLALAARGAKVVVGDAGVALDGERAGEPVAEQVAAAIRAAGGEALAVTGDISTVEGGRGLVEAAVSHYGRLDGLVHNAGILRDRTLAKLTPEDVDAVLAVHLRAAFWMIGPAIAAMRANGFGRVVLTSSASGLFGTFGQANYAAAKMGLVGLMRVLAQEHARHGILCNVVAPSARTRMTESLLGDLADRLAPEHVAPLVTLLLSERCTQGNQVFLAGGGRYARAFIGVTPGWTQRGPEPATPEALAEHWSQVVDPAGYTIPDSGLDELALMQAAFAAAERR
jgi:NAD(P)-dependent dehydrogenase (short-subunit alcohol dehydrogenase family)